MRVFKPFALVGVFCLAIAVIRSVWPGVTWADPGDDPVDAWRTSDGVVRATNRGVALMEQYQYAKAAESFEQACKLAPGSVETRVNLSIATYNRAGKGDLERAERLLDAALVDQPDHARALYFRGIMHQYSGRDEEAVSCFKRVVEQLPHDAYAWYLLARSKSHLGQPCRAELERAVRENPALASAYYDLMRVAAQEGKHDQVRIYQERFVKLRQSPLSEMMVMPHYNQMGPLAGVRPLAGGPKRSVSSGELTAGPAKTILKAAASAPLRRLETEGRATAADEILSGFGVQLAIADVNRDGHADMVTTGAVRDGRRGILLLLGQADGGLVETTQQSGLAGVKGAVSCAFGDYDNDDNVDLFVSCVGPNYLFRGRGDGTFEEVTAKTQTAGGNVVSVSAVFLDADHDGDLDIYVCNAVSVGDASSVGQAIPAANQLLNNNADGTFRDIAAQAGVACPSQRSIMLAPGDIDGDRDTDLVVFHQGAPVSVFFNDRGGKYHEERIIDEHIRGDRGGVLQDFNGDGRMDLLVSPSPDNPGRLYLTDGTGALKASSQFDGCVKALSTWGDPGKTRVADMDLDGDLDIVVLNRGGHVLFNDGWGRFVFSPQMWPMVGDGGVIGTELSDVTGDGVPDVLRICSAEHGRIELVPTRLTPPANWLAVTPTGSRGADKRTRSPTSGFGTRLELRCGLHSQVIAYTGLNGGLSQSQQTLLFGLNGAVKADYLTLVWPDGVTQCESELAAGTHHRISEMQRRVSSCPVLFAWNGQRFGFISDFAGVGGLGYYTAPGQYAAPQVLEHVKIEPNQLVPRNGFYELRICEPMEEVAYVDRLELLAVDHPQSASVYPDERLAVTGPAPTHRLLYPASPIFPVSAIGPDGTECVERLTEVDRVYAYQPRLDRRFYGFCEPHALVVDFADQLANLPSGDSTRRVYLFLNGWIEYPYSQTTFAAAQAGVTWQSLRIERQTADGRWDTIIADAGAPGGMGRMITIDLTGKLSPSDRILRISTNLEIYYDQLFIAVDHGTCDLTIRTIPLARADLRRLGFPLEYSPDGRHPNIYSYDIIEPTSSFKMPSGAYTRYGRVDSLLADFDDRYVILGTGDEIAVRFDARAVPPPADGMTRSFILVSHTYCKDMDLYTGAPDTVSPLPFGNMTAYPYPPSERYPHSNGPGHPGQRFNTRLVP